MEMRDVFQAVFACLLVAQLYKTDASVWLEGPNIVDCKDSARLTCHYCDTPLTNWSWSRTYGLQQSVMWNTIFQNGQQHGPSPVSMREEINRTVSLIFQGGRDVEGYWKCRVGNEESKPLTIQKQCGPTTISFYTVQTGYNIKQVMVKLGNLWPQPKNINLKIGIPPVSPVLVPVSFHGNSGYSWAPDVSWITNLRTGLVPGNYSYIVEVTTLTTTVLTGHFVVT